MKRKKCILLCLLFSYSFLYAQWSQKDSIWLQKVLSGEIDVILTPEIEESIRKGVFLNPDAPQIELQLIPSPPILDILKDFSEYVLPDTLEREFNILDLPPSVVMRFFQEIKEEKGINPGAFTPNGEIQEKEYFKIPGRPLYVRASVDNLFLPEVKDGQKRGSFNGRLVFKFSLEDNLRWIFWKSERDKKRNRKKAQAWKYYNYP